MIFHLRSISQTLNFALYFPVDLYIACRIVYIFPLLPLEMSLQHLALETSLVIRKSSNKTCNLQDKLYMRIIMGLAFAVYCSVARAHSISSGLIVAPVL